MPGVGPAFRFVYFEYLKLDPDATGPFSLWGMFNLMGQAYGIGIFLLMLGIYTLISRKFGITTYILKKVLPLSTFTSPVFNYSFSLWLKMIALLVNGIALILLTFYFSVSGMWWETAHFFEMTRLFLAVSMILDIGFLLLKPLTQRAQFKDYIENYLRSLRIWEACVFLLGLAVGVRALVMLMHQKDWIEFIAGPVIALNIFIALRISNFTKRRIIVVLLMICLGLSYEFMIREQIVPLRCSDMRSDVRMCELRIYDIWGTGVNLINWFKAN